MYYPPEIKSALDTLSKTGVWKSNYAPPIHRLLWRMGFVVAPPHFASFTSNLVSYGTYFGTVWGVLMWFAVWSRHDTPPMVAAGFSVFAGLLFGLFMAIYFRNFARKHKLPSWSQLRKSDD